VAGGRDPRKRHSTDGTHCQHSWKLLDHLDHLVPFV
jgi:hypothetical protein